MRKSMLATALLSATTAHAAMPKPGSYITQNGLELTPKLSVGAMYDDNIFSTANNEQSSMIYTATPELEMAYDDGINRHQLTTRLSSAAYIQSSADNYTDGHIGYLSHFEPSRRHRFNVRVDADWNVERRGEGLSEGQPNAFAEPLTYEQQDYHADYEFGAQTAMYRVKFDAGYYNKNYTRFETITQYRDYDKANFGATLYFNSQSRSDVFVSVHQNNYRYDIVDINGVTRDSDDYQAYAGYSWEATALTEGEIKVGYQKKDFANAARENFSGVSWQAKIKWQPLTYSHFRFTTSRSARDPLVEGDYVRETFYEAQWVHQWRENLQTKVAYSYTDDEFVGVSRQDSLRGLTLAMDYALSPSVVLSSYYELRNDNSTRDDLAFDRNRIGLTVQFALMGSR